MNQIKLRNKRIKALQDEIEVINAIHCPRVRDYKRRKLTKLVLDVISRHDVLADLLRGLYDT